MICSRFFSSTSTISIIDPSICDTHPRKAIFRTIDLKKWHWLPLTISSVCCGSLIEKKSFRFQSSIVFLLTRNHCNTLYLLGDQTLLVYITTPRDKNIMEKTNQIKIVTRNIRLFALEIRPCLFIFSCHFLQLSRAR